MARLKQWPDGLNAIIHEDENLAGAQRERLAHAAFAMFIAHVFSQPFYDARLAHAISKP